MIRLKRNGCSWPVDLLAQRRPCFAGYQDVSGCVFVNSAILAAESVEISADVHCMLPIDIKWVLRFRMMRDRFRVWYAPECQS
jgi:hypothetical protein